MLVAAPIQSNFSPNIATKTLDAQVGTGHHHIFLEAGISIHAVH